MSGVKRFEGHYLTEGVMGGKALAAAQCVLASDYDRDMQALESTVFKWRENYYRADLERDELRAQLTKSEQVAVTLISKQFAAKAKLRAERDELRAQVADLKHQLETLRAEACKNDGK